MSTLPWINCTLRRKEKCTKHFSRKAHSIWQQCFTALLRAQHDSLKRGLRIGTLEWIPYSKTRYMRRWKSFTLNWRRNARNIKKTLLLIKLLFNFSHLFSTNAILHPYVSLSLISYPHFCSIYIASLQNAKYLCIVCI